MKGAEGRLLLNQVSEYVLCILSFLLRMKPFANLFMTLITCLSVNIF